MLDLSAYVRVVDNDYGGTSGHSLMILYPIFIQFEDFLPRTLVSPCLIAAYFE